MLGLTEEWLKARVNKILIHKVTQRALEFRFEGNSPWMFIFCVFVLIFTDEICVILLHYQGSPVLQVFSVFHCDALLTEI